MWRGRYDVTISNSEGNDGNFPNFLSHCDIPLNNNHDKLEPPLMNPYDVMRHFVKMNLSQVQLKISPSKCFQISITKKYDDYVLLAQTDLNHDTFQRGVMYREVLI